MSEIKALYNAFKRSKGIETDTRKELDGKIFVALSGENFDGNVFAAEALAKGAKYVVVDAISEQGDQRYFKVENTLKTLQELARYHRRQLGLPIIAITGSNGKTTTKELVSAVLAKKYKVSYTQGNYNNHIGVPLTLLQMNESTAFGVVEMGANHQKEIEKLCTIAEPDYGYITNFGKAHLEGFGGFQGVIKGKSEMYDALRSRQKTIFINQDDPLQVQQSLEGKVFSFGEASFSSCVVKINHQAQFAEVDIAGITIKSHLLGDYNAKNITAAIGIGRYFDIPIKAIKEAVENYNPTNNRSQIIEIGSNKVILDAYNANPTSMKLSLSNLKKFSKVKKVVILGDMFEVGEASQKEHQKIVEQLEDMDLDLAFVCGENFAQTKVESVNQFKTFNALKEAVEVSNIQDSLILIKGSRGMAMERVLEALKK